MQNSKPIAGTDFPNITVAKLGGGQIDLSKPATAGNWNAVIVYRGKHCPLCTKYLNSINELLPKFQELGVDIVAVSADSEERAQGHIDQVNPDFPVGYNLSIEQMQQLGLYISNPRSPDESDRPFAEPGFFVVNENGKLQIIDISNIPFARPDLSSMLMGLGFVKNPDNNYPIRGTF